MSLVSDVQELLDEVNGSVFWTADHIYDALNEALIHAYADTQFTTSEGTSTATESSNFMTIPTTIMIPQYIVMGGKEYWPSSYPDLERYSQNWRGEGVGLPKAFIPVSWNVMRIWPAPDTTYDEVSVFGTPWPTEINGTNTDLTADRAFKRHIVLEAGASLVKNTLPQFAQIWAVESLEEKREWKRHLRNHKGRFRVWRLRPATSFSINRGGSPYNFKGYS